MEQTPTEGDGLTDELRDLGQNLSQVLQAGWASEGRRRLQRQVEDGLADLAHAVGRAAREFAASPEGRRLEDDLRGFGDRLRSGEIESEIRSDLVDVLRRANVELQKAADQIRRKSQDGGEAESGR